MTARASMAALWRKVNGIDDGNADYPDTGCHESPTCLACTLPVCIEDLPRRYEGVGTPITPEMSEQIRQMRSAGHQVREITAALGVSKRTVERHVKRAGL